MTRALLLIGILALLGLLASLTGSSDEPASVFDYADLLDAETEARIQELSDGLREDSRIPFAVMTLESAENAPATFFDRSRGFATLFEKDWHTGALLVVAKDGPALIEFGTAWTQEQIWPIEQKVMPAVVRPCRAGSCAEGILAGTQILDTLARSVEVPTLSYWDKFLMIEKMTLRDFARAAANPWQAFGYFKWMIIAFVLWELILPWRKKQKKLRKGIGLDIFYTVFNYVLFWALIGSAVAEISHLAFSDFLSRFFGASNLVAIRLHDWPLWLRYVLLLLVVDLTSYWIHRLLHHSDYLWEIHKVHHSAEEIDIFNAIRQHFMELLCFRIFAYIPVGLIGFGVSDTFVVTVFITVFSFFTHANVRLPLGPLKYILNNPQLHIWHHGADIHARGNVNFGDALSVWDFIFGTGYVSDDSAGLKLGFDDIETYPQTFWGQLVAPFKGMLAHVRRGASDGAS